MSAEKREKGIEESPPWREGKRQDDTPGTAGDFSIDAHEVLPPWEPHGSMRRSEDGRPIGKGGDPCFDCARSHEAGEACDEEGLYERGWRRGGLREGKPYWRNPRGAERNQKSKDRAAGERAKKDASLVKLDTALKGAVSPAKIRKALTYTKGKSSSLVERLDPQSFRLWITVALARTHGVSDEVIASRTNTEPALVSALVESPPFLLFESELRGALQSNEETLESIRAELLSAGQTAVSGLKRWAGSEDPQTAGASVSASKAILAALGLSTERSEKVVRKYIIGRKTAEKLVDALGRGGA